MDDVPEPYWVVASKPPGRLARSSESVPLLLNRIIQFNADDEKRAAFPKTANQGTLIGTDLR